MIKLIITIFLVSNLLAEKEVYSTEETLKIHEHGVLKNKNKIENLESAFVNIVQKYNTPRKTNNFF